MGLASANWARGLALSARIDKRNGSSAVSAWASPGNLEQAASNSNGSLRRRRENRAPYERDVSERRRRDDEALVKIKLFSSAYSWFCKKRSGRLLLRRLMFHADIMHNTILDSTSLISGFRAGNTFGGREFRHFAAAFHHTPDLLSFWLFLHRGWHNTAFLDILTNGRFS